MKMSVVIPVVQVDLFNDLWECIRKNTRIPDEFVILNNSKLEFPCPSLEGTEIFFKRPENPLGVNDSWRFGFRKVDQNTDLISVLNDDILINKDFFRKLENTAKVRNKGVVFCPRTVPRKFLRGEKVKSNRVQVMGKREGWAYTIRKSFLNSIPMIPDELKTYYGDDWFWFHAKRLGFVWFKMIDNFIFHYRSVSVNKAGLARTIGKEFKIFKDKIEEFRS